MIDIFDDFINACLHHGYYSKKYSFIEIDTSNIEIIMFKKL